MAQAVLELIDVSKRFGEGAARVDALTDINITVAAGELIALLGPSGSGKSTMLSIAGALLTPTSGRVLFDGDDITSTAANDLASLRLKKIGFIFQGSNLISYLTGHEQLLFIADLLNLPKDEARERADHLLGELGMAKRATHYPDELSGGERQRIAITRALMNNPRVILADEPTASLDSTRGRQVVRMLADEIHERSTGGIVVTHDERLIDLCDRVVRIEDGRLTENEAAPEVSAAAS